FLRNRRMFRSLLELSIWHVTLPIFLCFPGFVLNLIRWLYPLRVWFFDPSISERILFQHRPVVQGFPHVNLEWIFHNQSNLPVFLKRWLPLFSTPFDGQCFKTGIGSYMVYV